MFLLTVCNRFSSIAPALSYLLKILVQTIWSLSVRTNKIRNFWHYLCQSLFNIIWSSKAFSFLRLFLKIVLKSKCRTGLHKWHYCFWNPRNSMKHLFFKIDHRKILLEFHHIVIFIISFLNSIQNVYPLQL